MISKAQFGFMASLDFTRWPPEKVVEVLAEAGYKAVEWTLAHFNPRMKGLAELERLVAISHEAGLEVSEVVVQQDLLTTDEFLRRDRATLIEECIRVASHVGVKILNVFSGPASWESGATRIPEDMGEGEAWNLLLKTYEPLVSMAEKYQVCLALEPAFKMLCHDYYSTQELFRRLDSPWLGINLDPSHLTLYRNDVPWVIRQWAKKIKHVHLKDAVGRVGTPGQDFMFPLLGEGLVPWGEFFKALDEVAYTGFLSVEFESFAYYSQILQNDPRAAARLSMSQLERLLAAADKEIYDHGTVRG